MAAAKVYPASASPEIQLRMTGSNYQRAIQRYRPGSYPGHLVLILSEESHARGTFSEWEKLTAQGADVYTVPGDHLSYLREHVDTTAEQLKVCLGKGKAQAE